MEAWAKRNPPVASSGEALRQRDSRIEYVMLVALVLIAAAAYVSRLNRVVRQTDPAAYYYAGLQIAETGSPQFCDENNAVAGPYFTLVGFKVRRHDDDSCFYPIWSIGLPLLIGLTRSLIPSPEAVSYLMPVMGLIGIIALFALGQALFDRPTGLLAAGLLAFNPVYWHQATEIWSDVPSLTFLLIAALFAVRMCGTNKDRLLEGLLGGLAFGYACLVRYGSLIALLPLILYFVSATRGQPKPKRALVGFALGFGVFALVILTYNRLYYGGLLTVGHSTEHGWVPWPALNVAHFLGGSPVDAEAGYRAILNTLAGDFHVGLLVAIVTMAVMPQPKAFLIGSFAAVFCVFYSFYFQSATGVNARFLLPAFSMICLAIAFGFVRLLGGVLKQRESAILIILPAIILAWHSPSIRTSLVKLDRRNRRIENRVALVRKFAQATEPNAVFLSREYHDLIVLYGERSALHYSMIPTPDPFSRTYRLSDYEPKLVEVVGRLLENETPVYIVVEPEARSFYQGPINPYPILSAHFEMVPFQTREEPIIYRAVLP